jgi:hypothetical protein
MLHDPVTFWELGLACALVGLGILIDAALTERRRRLRGRLRFHPRCLR